MGIGAGKCSKKCKRNIDGGMGSYCSNSNDSGGGAQVQSHIERRSAVRSNKITQVQEKPTHRPVGSGGEGHVHQTAQTQI